MHYKIYEPTKWLGREICWSNNGIYMLVARLRGKKVLSRKPEQFDVFISGFPRSGNHFYTAAVEFMTGKKYKVNPVNHYPPYARKAVKMEMPTILLMRKPVDACASWSTYTGRSVQHSLKFYLQFHRLIRNVKNEAFIAVFEDYVVDPSVSLTKLAEKYSLPIEVEFGEGLTDEITKSITNFKDPKKTPKPNANRERKELTEKNKALILSDHQELLARAQAVYDEITSRA